MIQGLIHGAKKNQCQQQENTLHLQQSTESYMLLEEELMGCQPMLMLMKSMIQSRINGLYWNQCLPKEVVYLQQKSMKPSMYLVAKNQLAHSTTTKNMIQQLINGHRMRLCQQLDMDW